MSYSCTRRGCINEASREYTIDCDISGRECSIGHVAFRHAHKVKVTLSWVTFDPEVAQCYPLVQAGNTKLAMTTFSDTIVLRDGDATRKEAIGRFVGDINDHAYASLWHHLKDTAAPHLL